MTGFNPSQLPDLTGKVAIVTGGNVGMHVSSIHLLSQAANRIHYSGKMTVQHLLKKNAKVYLAARDLNKAHATIVEIKTTLPNANVEALQLDLSSFASVKAAAETFQSTESELHILINNAGTAVLPFSLTTDGYDVQWSVRQLHPPCWWLLMGDIDKLHGTLPPH